MSQSFQILKLSEKIFSIDELDEDEYSNKKVIFNANSISECVRSRIGCKVDVSIDAVQFGDEFFDIKIQCNAFPNIENPGHIEAHGDCLVHLAMLVKEFDLHLLTTDGEIFNSENIDS